MARRFSGSCSSTSEYKAAAPRHVAHLREGVRLGEDSSIGPGPEGPATLSMKALICASGHGTHEAVHRLAVLEGNDGGNRLDPQLPRNLRVLINVHLDQLHLAASGLYGLLQHGRELLARPAPGRPEIDEHRLRHRFRHDVLPECRRRCIRNEGVTGAASRERIKGHGVLLPSLQVGLLVPAELHQSSRGGALSPPRWGGPAYSAIVTVPCERKSDDSARATMRG